MPFNLFITSADGERTFKSGRSPYPTRTDMRRTVQVVTADSIVHIDDHTTCVERVLSAPLGETVVNEATGVAFRTEEF
jgi:hypothetical protein